MVGKLKKVIIATSLFAVLLNAEGTSEEGGASTSATSEKVTVRKKNLEVVKFMKSRKNQ